MRIPTVCSKPGCPAPATRRGRCQAHARELERPWEQARTARGGLRGYKRRDWRQAALDRAAHRCERCGARPGDHRLEVHHRGRLDDHDNVVVLCKPCHRSTFAGVVELDT
jgi:hypothetical protein